MQDNAFTQAIAEQLTGKKGAPKYPYILCKRNEPQPFTYCIHDPGGWEGLKAVRHGKKAGWEIDRNFTLVCYPDEKDGTLTCFIPDTPVNRAKLERLSKPTITKEHVKRLNGITNVLEEFEVEVVIPPLYERIEKNFLESTLIDDMADKILARIREKQEEQHADPDAGGEDELEVRSQNNGRRQTTRRKVKTDPLMEPISRKG